MPFFWRLTAALAAEPDVARQKQLVHLVRQDCGSCHGMTLNGGLGPALLPETLKDKPAEGLVCDDFLRPSRYADATVEAVHVGRRGGMDCR